MPATFDYLFRITDPNTSISVRFLQQVQSTFLMSLAIYLKDKFGGKKSEFHTNDTKYSNSNGKQSLFTDYNSKTSSSSDYYYYHHQIY